jgi:hypothetical protein
MPPFLPQDILSSPAGEDAVRCISHGIEGGLNSILTKLSSPVVNIARNFAFAASAGMNSTVAPISGLPSCVIVIVQGYNFGKSFGREASPQPSMVNVTIKSVITLMFS